MKKKKRSTTTTKDKKLRLVKEVVSTQLPGVSGGDMCGPVVRPTTAPDDGG